MTIDDPVQPSSLLLPSPHEFYHAKIPCKHWQLRSLLCSPSSNTVYYPTGTNVFALNTETRKRERIASLPFSPRCLGARYGWVCAGGVDNGHFATIRMGENGKGRFDRSGTEDETVGMELDVEDERTSRTEPQPKIQISELGGSIVNSVTLYKPADSTSDDDVLAILTNNDKTVRIFSLARNQILTTLPLDIATNHASMSPDGKHLVVVGDSAKVHFYCPTNTTTETQDAGYDSWAPSSNSPLTAGTKESLISTSFSPSSIYCAVASQEGSITIFDTRRLLRSSSDGQSAIVRKIWSSRPKTYAGAVRSVQFSPAPWDLLVWAEHSGRVTIADARSNFVKRQIIDVVVDEKRALETELIGGFEDGLASLSNAESHSYSRRNSTREDEEAEEEAAAAADESEAFFMNHQISNNDQSHDNRRSSLASLALDWVSNASVPSSTPGNPPFTGPSSTLTYTHPSMFAISSSAPIIHVTSNGPPTIGGPPMSPTTPVLLRDYRERQSERERNRQRIHEPPRRRNSVYLPNENTPPPPAPAPPTGNPRRNRELIARWTSLQNRPDSPRNSDDVNHMLMLRNSEHLSLLIAEERRRNVFRRSFHHGRRNFTSSDADDDDYFFLNGTRSESDGISITGCTLSFDGSRLYVATKKGIVEYRVDLAGRKVFPSLTPR